MAVAPVPATDAGDGTSGGPADDDLDGAPADGRSTRWADHREARRAELLRVARRTVHHRGPDVSMEEIAAAAGTSKSIVYRYFTDKTGLQIAVAEAVVLQIQGALEGVLRVAPTPRDGLRAMVAVYLEMIESSPHVYAFVTRDGSVESGGPLGHFLDSVTALVAAPFARGLTEDRDGRQVARRPGDAAPAAGPDAATRALAESWAAGAVGFVRGAGEWWLAHRDDPGTPDREVLTAQVAAWLWAGPVGLLARDRPPRDRSTPDAPAPDAPAPDAPAPDAPAPDAPTDDVPAPAHQAPTRPTGSDHAAGTPREQR
ncbi:TetR family transcriptional regulator [Cellulomonas shaoxiangyii]|uniref:TetR family transcriptional regulator n=1 Tax=Cellulomonas shaoxiangyii TaxID=2566013 RepID=A0A4P7SMV9_9CELL|nr:TetR family transcriptional regulator [Cellulomonas shaoxiangyii]TGY85475.1 TetR family transcriptional regulator [Cellulomonas shaoxiangyii]